ncbi:hypothetical protein HJFPF1_07899 [Paramyrothecium foliicola]|nr:hypothetical protein HJFPF1_07899 [Paramyrothecium foliicola]
MPEHYQYEEYHRRRRDREDSPEFYSGGGGARPYDPEYRPFDSNPRVNESYHRETLRLEPPPSNARPRSVPPPNTAVVHRPRQRSPSVASSRSKEDRDNARGGRRGRSPSPISKARNAVQDNFTNSTAGIGAALLGAAVGGLVARQASDAVSRRRSQKDPRRRRSRDYDDDDGNTTRVVSTILGVVAGGLGANALTNRFEDSRDRDRAHQHAWERRHGREEDLPHYDTGKPDDLDHRNGRGLRRDDDDDDDYDYVYDDRRYDDRRPRRRRSEDDVRY